jgi:hypothetical protein
LVPVVRCPTVFGVSYHVVWPRSVSVLHSPSSTRGLDAYTNSQLVLIGPADMNCRGIVAVDGGTQIVVWPVGYSRPSQHSHAAGLTLSLDPACASCKAADACPFFGQFAAQEGFPCPTGIPTGESVYVLNTTTTLFEDPPGVAGSGWPSGGPDAANGLVGITGSREDGSVYRSTCTLPASQRWICTVSLNDALSRYG